MQSRIDPVLFANCGDDDDGGKFDGERKRTDGAGGDKLPRGKSAPELAVVGMGNHVTAEHENRSTAKCRSGQIRFIGQLALEMHEPNEIALWRAANEVHIDCDNTFHLSLRLFRKRSS